MNEVFEERGVTDVRRIKRDKSPSLGMTKAPQVNILKDTQASKLGDAPVGIPPFFFNNCRLVSVDPKFLLLHLMFAILRMSFLLLCFLFR